MLRVGYGVGPADVVAAIRKVQRAFDVTTPAQEAALASLDGAAELARRRAVNREAMAALEAVLRSHGFDPICPAAGNFLFVDVGTDADALNDALLRRGVIVRPMGSFGAPSALRITADALACDALGAVVLDLWGEVKRFDLVASRRLTLAAQVSGVTCLMLRSSAPPAISTAETRWIVRAAPSSPIADWGAPMLDVQLVRNRHGQTGRWIMEWNCDECLFRDVPLESMSCRGAEAHPQPVAAAPADRSHQAPVVMPNITPWRRTG